jgi:hypothetical protein
MRKQSKPDTRKSQIDKFKQAAREIETDDDDKRFDERLEKVVRAKPDGALLRPSKQGTKKDR